MSFESLLALVATTALATSIPGPSTLLAFADGARHGILLSILTVSGIALASLLQAAIAGFGLGTVIANAPGILPAVKAIGAVYLIYIGVRMWRSATSITEDQRNRAGNARPFTHLSTGFLIASTNPKAVLFFAALFPQFVSSDQQTSVQMVLIVSLVCTVIFAVTLLYAIAGWQLGNRRQSGKTPFVIQRAISALLAFIGTYLFLSVTAR